MIYPGSIVGKAASILNCIFEPTRGSERLRSAREPDSLIFRASAADPHKKSATIERDLSTKFGINVFSRTTRRRFNEKNFAWMHCST